MSEDDFSDPYDEPSMEISIETLAGTAFDVRVYPTDTVLDIKTKIQRVEGIPTNHQNLLFKLEELQDFKRLCDVGVSNGDKLKLVLSMRGGPISTRRVTACDHHNVVWKDLKEIIEHTREEIGEKPESTSKVSVLVFKEGEVINLIRVIENEDGSYSPIYPKSDKNDKIIAPPTFKTASAHQKNPNLFKKIAEDVEMTSKVHSLRSKMQHLSVKRQIKAKKEPELALKDKHRSKKNSEKNFSYVSEKIAILEDDSNDLIEISCNETLSLASKSRFLKKIVLKESKNNFELKKINSNFNDGEKDLNEFETDSKIVQTLPNLNKKRMRCEKCNKKLNVTNWYLCRCEKTFCSQHRYPEVHDCGFDYKEEGRRVLKRENPVVSGAKVAKF